MATVPLLLLGHASDRTSLTERGPQYVPANATVLIPGQPDETFVVANLSIGGALLLGSHEYPVGQEVLVILRLCDGISVVTRSLVVREHSVDGAVHVWIKFHS